VQQLLNILLLEQRSSKRMIPSARLDQVHTLHFYPSSDPTARELKYHSARCLHLHLRDLHMHHEAPSLDLNLDAISLLLPALDPLRLFWQGVQVDEGGDPFLYSADVISDETWDGLTAGEATSADLRAASLLPRHPSIAFSPTPPDRLRSR
jgi:hypothetical protein